MPEKRIRILVDAAGRRSALRALQKIALDGAQLEWVECTSPLDLQERVRQAQGETLDALGLVGGDGTIGLALNALEARNPVPLGIIPVGERNDFAQNLGIPSAPVAALHLLCSGQAQRVDVGRATWPGRLECRRRYGCAASLGLGSCGLPWARWQVVQAMLAVPWHYEPRRVRVSWRDGSFEGEVLVAAVTNTRGCRGLVLAPRARFNDGLLDLCLIQRTGRLRALTKLPCLWRGTHGDLPEVIQTQTPWVRIDGAGADLPIALDDAAATSTTAIEFHCEPAALQVLLPQLQAETTALERVPQALPAFQGGM
jgi:diacylglycerol kinase (ATP)